MEFKDLIRMKDFVFTRVKQEMDSVLIDNIKGIGARHCLKLGIGYDEERFEKWIRQSMEIETFSKEQVEDLKLRRLIDEKDNKIKNLETELEMYRNKITELYKYVIKD